MEYLVFVREEIRRFKVLDENYSCARDNVETFDSVERTKEYIVKRCLNSRFALSDFRIFSEYKFDIKGMDII